MNMMKRTLLFFAFFACLAFLQGCRAEGSVLDIETVVRQCDVVRTECPGEPSLPLNQANGYFGGSFSKLGLHVRPGNRAAEQKFGNTTFLHVDRYYRGKFNMDYLIPICRVYWGDEFADISDYEQHQSYYDGTLTTRFVAGGEAVSVTNMIELVDRAIKSANTFFRRIGSTKKRYDEMDRVILKEKDFR